MNYIQALTELPPPPEQREALSKRIHRAASHLWQLKKCLEHVPPYCLRFKRVDVPEMIVRLSSELKNLKAQRKELKSKQWYPRRTKANKVKSRIMRECISRGYNAKQVAGYFNVTVQCVYRRVKVKEVAKRNGDLEGKFVN